MLRSNGSICSITFLIRVRTLKTILKDFLILSFPFLGIFLAIIIIVQTVIALGLRLILNELQVGKYATAAQQSQQKDQRSRVQSGRLLFFRLRCFCRRFRCFSRTFTLISYTDRTGRINCPCFTFLRAAAHSRRLLFGFSIFHQRHQVRFIHLVQKVNSSLFILVGPVDQDIKIVACLGGNGNELPILPEHWQMVVGKDKKKQFDILKKLMNAPDVTEVVNACDAGREGELIFRSVYELAGCQKPMKRLWISSMEDSAIREGFANLRPGADYDGLRDAALCRAKADWLVGINATRLFSVLYHRTLNIGRVMSPTLALIVQREAEIDTFKPVPFYTVALELPGLTVSGERMADKAAAEQLKEACQGANVTIKKMERKEKSEKPPALYDLTTLQRDANRLLGFTAQQTLDYLQSLYEKKLCTYPRTDSRYLTGDMADSLPVLVNLVANAMPFRKGIAITCDPQPVINDKKVTDHHAVIPTRNLKDADLSALPAGEKAVLELVALRLLCAVAQPHIYSETVVIAACAGGEFTAKGKTVKHPGWKALEDAFRAKMKDTEPKKEGAEKALPELTEGQTLSVSAAIVKEGKSSPPQHFTEDTLPFGSSLSSISLW